MAFQVVTNGAEVVVHGLAQGEVCMTTLGFIGTPGWLVTDLADLVFQVRTAWTAEMLPLLPAAYVAVEVVGKGLRSDSDFESTIAFAAPGTGDYGGTPLPNNVSIAIAFKTGKVGRSNRGRNYWPLLVESVVTGNAVDATYMTSLLSAYDVLQTTVEDEGVFTLSVISRYHNKALRNPAIGTPVTSFSFANNCVDSMRRRLPGRGI